MKLTFVLTASLTTSCLLASSMTFAVPTVNGNTISWPDDGWYQVQSADTYDTICGGGLSCNVEPGVFHVINHSTGERFENIKIGETSSPIKVSGNTISWPNDGWYQVQRADTWSTVCNGGNACEVDNGVFNVINHTSGKRYTNVVVDGGSGIGVGLQTLGNTDAFYAALRAALINTKSGNDQRLESQLEDNFAPTLAADSDAAQSSAPTENEVSSTNVQEAGVDEQDRVKLNAAGTHLFVLEHRNEQQFDSIALDAVTRPAFFQSTTATSLRILSLDSETPDATSIDDVSVDLNGQRADGFYLYEDEGQSSAIVTASGGNPWSLWGRPSAFSNHQSYIAKVDVSDVSSASQEDSFTLDGRIVSSRRIGDSLFFASRYSLSIPGVNSWELDDEQWRESVESADFGKLMPRFTRNGSNESSPLVEPSSCFVAPRSDNQPYYSPDIITLGVIDLSTMELRDSQCFLGATETLYANTESVFLATTQYSYTQRPIADNGTSVDTSADSFPPDLRWTDPRQTTDIHQFNISSSGLNYQGSGSVRGHLGWNPLQKPFRMSENNGYLRVATMNDQQGPEHSPILLNILKADGKGNLVTVGSLPNSRRPKHIGKPGERLYASRFMGERGYIVTYRKVDPLYVINLADATDPVIEGELEVVGYSDYLHPVDENYLIGIGKDTVETTVGFSDGRAGAWFQGIKLSLFDVTDPTLPKEVQTVILGERGTNAAALGDHRAITIQPATDRHPMRLSFGADVHGNAAPTTRPLPENARDYKQWSYTGLHGYDVTGGANASIRSRGALIVKKNDGNNNDGPGWGDGDRAVMVNDAVFYIHGTDVYPALWDNLSNTPKPR